MIKLKNALSCYSCRQTFSNLESLYFVESESNKGFCSKDCIEKFYKPLIQHYELWLQSLYKDFGIHELVIQDNEEHLVEECMNNPDEVYEFHNELQEKIYAFILNKNNSTFFIVLCTSLTQGEMLGPSFIFLTVKTQHLPLLEIFREGEMISMDQLKKLKSSEEMSLKNKLNQEFLREHSPEDEFVEYLEFKKSKILADLIHLSELQDSENDIPIEKYPLYGHYLEKTIHQPDEIYEASDSSGDRIVTFIKIFEELDEFNPQHKRSDGLYYIVLGLKYAPKDFPISVNVEKNEAHRFSEEQGNDEDSQKIIPIVSFPTKSLRVYHFFQNGSLLSKNLSC